MFVQTDLTTNELMMYGALLAIPIIPNLWSIWHAFYREFNTQQERLIWLGLAVFVPVLGGLAYMMFGARRGRKVNPHSFPEPPSDSPAKDNSDSSE